MPVLRPGHDPLRRELREPLLAENIPFRFVHCAYGLRAQVEELLDAERGCDGEVERVREPAQGQVHP